MRINLLTLALLPALLLGFAPAKPAPTTSAPAASTEATTAIESANANLEVRLRKLHLVRPDLIPFPLAYDVYC